MTESLAETPRGGEPGGEVAVVYAGDYVNKMSGQRIERECLSRMERGCRALVINFRDTELIAAHTVEQIARRLKFMPEAINQIKTALVEACINAAEHSLSTERKIYNRFRVEGDKLVITVSSRGLSVPVTLPENGAAADKNGGGEGAKGRRGWGLKLIRTLMDDVEFERVDDGTRLRMTKYLRK